MSALTFALKPGIHQPIDCRALTPDQLQEKSIADIQSIALGSQTVADLFDVSGEGSSHIIFKNSCPQLHYIGYKMKSGTITIEGDAGDYLGAAMRGGALICKGNAGERAADLMRRGIVLIEGSVGEYCASNMRAGTVGVLGKTGARLGYGMKRGTLLLTQAPTDQATWTSCGVQNFPFLKLLFKSFALFDSAFAKLSTIRAERRMGDASGLGKAEMLILENL